MGVDAAENEGDPFKGNRSDAMLLVSIAPHGKNVNVISIPRDSKVYIADRAKPDKIKTMHFCLRRHKFNRKNR